MTERQEEGGGTEISQIYVTSLMIESSGAHLFESPDLVLKVEHDFVGRGPCGLAEHLGHGPVLPLGPLHQHDQLQHKADSSATKVISLC